MEIHVLGQRIASNDLIVENFSWEPRLRQTAESQYAIHQIIRYVSGCLSLHYTHGLALVGVESSNWLRTYEYSLDSATGVIFPPTISAVITMPQPRKHGECASCLFLERGICTLYGKIMKKHVFRCFGWVEDPSVICQRGARIYVCDS